MIERLFLALWPDDRVRAQLEVVSLGLTLQGGRRVAPHNLHITLAFLGGVAPARRACFEDAVSAVRASAFELELTTVDWRSRAGIVWLTSEEVPRPLSSLVAALHAALAPCSYVPERRPYRLHVTLARDVREGPRRQPIAPIRWHASAISLASSRSTPKGSEYSVVRQWPLVPLD